MSDLLPGEGIATDPEQATAWAATQAEIERMTAALDHFEDQAIGEMAEETEAELLTARRLHKCVRLALKVLDAVDWSEE